MNPFIPQHNPPPQSGILSSLLHPFGWGAITYNNAPTPAAPAMNPSNLASAVRYNESRGEKDPYSSYQYSGNVIQGNANGAYRVTDGELKTYAPRFVGMQVTPEAFRQSPPLQDAYMQAKIRNLAGRGLTPNQILAVHRGGMSDLTASALDALTKRYKPYVDAGMGQYNAAGSPQ